MNIFGRKAAATDAGQVGPGIAEIPGIPGSRTSMPKLFTPVREASCELMAGENPEETGENLALKLREAELI